MSELQQKTVRRNGNHGWIGNETVESRLGSFRFRNGYPTAEAITDLRDALFLGRAIEVYLAQMPAVSWYHVWKGTAEAGEAAPNQMVIWESLMDAQTMLLTGNCETVYGLASFDLKRDGPIVIEIPPMLLGGLTDIWQREIAGIGPTGIDKGEGGKVLLLPPNHTGAAPDGYLLAQSRTYKASMGVRGFLVDGKTDHAVALMKSAKIYPLRESGKPPPMQFVNGSHQEIDTIFPDNYQFFEDLAALVAEEPEDVASPSERFAMAAIGVEKFKPFRPNAEKRALFADAAHTGSAMAQVNSLVSDDEERLVYSDRKWEWAFIGGSAEFASQGYVNTDRRAAFAYIAIGMSPAMVQKNVGLGSQYLWTPRDAEGEFLDGARAYRLHIPAEIPVKNFWSVVVYDAESRSMLRTGQAFPSCSKYTGLDINDDGAIGIYFGPTAPAGHEKNWIETVTGKGWFPLFRFYGPLESFFDKSWKLGDIEKSRSNARYREQGGLPAHGAFAQAGFVFPWQCNTVAVLVPCKAARVALCVGW